MLSSPLLAASRASGLRFIRPVHPQKHAFFNPLVSSSRRFVGVKAESSESKEGDSSSPAISNRSSLRVAPRTRPGAQAPMKVTI